MKRTVFIACCALTLLQANSFDEYVKKSQSNFQAYQSSFEHAFSAYKQAHKKALRAYEDEILNNWPSAEVSTNHKFVQYDKDYRTKKVVDFQKEHLSIEVIAKDEKEAKQKIANALDTLLQQDVQTAVQNDQLENKIAKELQKPLEKVKSKEKIIADVITPELKKEYEKTIQTKPLQTIQHKKNTIYTLNIKLPSNTTIKKAKQFEPTITAYASKNKIDKNLVYAIMHSESSFNPMARSHIPAFGLMQIVPKSAGIDSYHFLYGEKKLLSAQYLYNPQNNIKIGSTYLHLLYFKYLRHIKNPQSRLYCAIAAYNTGAGNVAKSFVGNYNIAKASQKINTMSPKEVYTYLLRNLPYNETRKYLQKVNDRRAVYEHLIAKGTL
jgi:membrane-bound lytic murein transglycosylase C